MEGRHVLFTVGHSVERHIFVSLGFHLAPALLAACWRRYIMWATQGRSSAGTTIVVACAPTVCQRHS
jgi:hypothetical protein